MMKKRRVFHLGLWGPRVDEGVDWEIEHHLRERVDELVAQGRTRDEAEREAARAFGDLRRVRRELRGIDRGRARRTRVVLLLETLVQDIRYGLRGVRLNPAFSAGVVLTLGLGLGASVALFSVLDALILRPLPYHAPAELVQLEGVDPKRPLPDRYLGWAEVAAFRERQDFLSQTFVHMRHSALYTGGADARSLTVEGVSPEFEETLGVMPLLGRGLQPEDAVPGATPVIVLSHSFWRTELGGDAGVLGRSIVLNGEPHQVVGVMPRSFKFPEYSTTDAWVPVRQDGSLLGWNLRYVNVVARLGGAPLATASARAAVLGRSVFMAADPASERTMQLSAFGQQRGRRALQEPLLLLAGAVIGILLVAGVNVVNLMLVRASARMRELAVRLALGASRLRLLRQMTTESLTLALLAGLVALGIAMVMLRAIAGIMPGSITFYARHAVEVEQRALVFAFGLTLLSGLLLGLGPALAATRRVRTAGADVSRYAARTRSRYRLRNVLIVSQVALSVTLLTGAGLLLNSFIRLQRVDPGFRMDNLAILTFYPSSTALPDAAQRADYTQRLKERLAALPGVLGVTVTGGLPPAPGLFRTEIALEAEGEAARVQPPEMILPETLVQPDFFEVTGARLLAGRAFTGNDYQTANVIIDEDLARYLWPTLSAIGQRFRIRPEMPWLTVVGVMADLKLMGPDDRTIQFELLTPLDETTSIYRALAIRTAGNPGPLLPLIRATAREINASQPIHELAPARAMYAQSIDMPRFLVVLVMTLAMLALVLAAIGIYGILAYVVHQRRHEFGVRLALGASARDLRRTVVGQGFLLALIGAGAGLAGALALTRFIRTTLYGVQPTDPLTLAAGIVTMLAVALAACVRPARRATTLDPAAVLRSE